MRCCGHTRRLASYTRAICAGSVRLCCLLLPRSLRVLCGHSARRALLVRVPDGHEGGELLAAVHTQPALLAYAGLAGVYASLPSCDLRAAWRVQYRSARRAAAVPRPHSYRSTLLSPCSYGAPVTTACQSLCAVRSLHSPRRVGRPLALWPHSPHCRFKSTTTQLIDDRDSDASGRQCESQWQCRPAGRHRRLTGTCVCDYGPLEPVRGSFKWCVVQATLVRSVAVWKRYGPKAETAHSRQGRHLIFAAAAV